MVTNDTAWLLMEAVRLLNRPTRGLKMLELGNQWSGWNISASVKDIMQWLGVLHTSIDMNGRNGALAFDLSKPLPVYDVQFDVVTNYGTSEHVCTTGDFADQWQVFKTIHECAKPDSVLIHVVPNQIGAHCGCGYVYDHEFFPALADACYYDLVQLYSSASDKNHWAALLRCKPDSVFPSFEEFKAMGGILKT